MSTTRTGEEDNEFTATWAPGTAAGLSIASKCQFEETRNLYLVRDNDKREYIRCQPTEVDQPKPTYRKPTGNRVDSSFNYYSKYSIDVTSNVDIVEPVTCCPEEYGLIEGSCITMEELEQAILARSHSSSIDAMINIALSEGPRLMPRQDSESVTTTIALSIIEPGATSAPAPASTTSQEPSPTSSSQSSLSDSIISTTSAPTSTPSFSTTDIPLLIATGSLSTIYSIPSSLTSPSTTATPNSKSSSGISVGAKVGIALGVIALVAAITCLLIILHVRRRRRLLQTATFTGTSEKKKRKKAREESTIEVGNLHQEPASPDISHPQLQSALPPVFIRESAPFKYPRQQTPLSPDHNSSSDQHNKIPLPDQQQLGKKASEASEDKEVVSPGLSIPQTSRSSNEKTGRLSNSSTPQDPFRSNSQTSTPSDGPHELDTGERVELDAGYTASSISRTVSPETQRDGTMSRGVTSSSLRRPSILSAESPKRSNRIEEERMLGLRSRSNTIEEGRVSEDAYSPRERDARMGGQGHISPMSQRTHPSQRTVRTQKTDQSGRSFLDLD